MAHIRLKNVSLSFPVFTSKARSFKNTLYTAVGGKINAHDKTICVDALDNINLHIKDGDRIGLIGHNGSGKTTLLRVLSGIYEPSCGEAEIDGSVSSLTDIAMGMDPEEKGYKNIILRSIFMGMTFKEAKAQIPEIAAFSELEAYLDMPARTYSTGMFLRLAFAVSTSRVPDILILDEMISAGDSRFKEKAKERIDQIIEKTKILVLASHQESILRSFCNKVIWLDKGKIRTLGECEEVLADYNAATKQSK